MKTTIKFLFTLLILFAFSCSQETTIDPLPIDLEGVSAKASRVQKALVGGLNGITGKSNLHRYENYIRANFKAENLYPGAYTIWWVIWNNPDECDLGDFEDVCEEADFPLPGSEFNNVGVEVMYAGGLVVGKNGKGNFKGRLYAGDITPESMNTSFGFPSVGGLAVGNTFGAEVHIVLRTHGPAVPGLVNDQISSYAGGCDTPFAILPFTTYPNEIGQCADIAAAVFLPVE